MVTTPVEGWTSDRLRFVPLDYDRHFENCYHWINDPEVTDALFAGDTPMARLAEKEWFENHQKQKDPNSIAMAIELLDGTHIGHTGIFGLDWRNGYATTGSLIGKVDLHGKGYGTEAAKLRAWYAFHVLGLRLLTSGYLDGNTKSRRMQEKAGYQVAIHLPELLWKRGMFRDKFITVLTKEKWLELSQGEKNW